eukprot:4066020-Prymnesium_polylepis.1
MWIRAGASPPHASQAAPPPVVDVVGAAAAPTDSYAIMHEPRLLSQLARRFWPMMMLHVESVARPAA